MTSFLSKILPSTGKDIEIEFRLFEITVFITLIICLYWSIHGLIAGYSLYVEGVYLAGTLIYGTIYLAQKRGASFGILTKCYYYPVLLMLSIAWLASGGISGAITTFMVMLFISGLLVLPLKDYLAFILVTMLIAVGFTFYELNNPDAAAKYDSRKFLLTDLAVANVIMLVTIAVAMIIFKRSYLRDREMLKSRNQELKKEKKKAESADKAKTNFLATISHEMRTPLNGIIGLSELISKTELTAEQRELLNNLQYSSNLLQGIISDVLDVAAIEADKMKLEYHSFKLKPELEKLSQVAEARIHGLGKDLTFDLIVDPKIPDQVEGDLTRLRQITLNLVNNALKFTETGGIVVSVKLLEEDDISAKFRFEVKDSGPGIPEESQKHLFDKFYKIDPNQPIEGSGLGLSICKNLVELMGGNIGFETSLGSGSTFHFELSLAKSFAQKEESRPSPQREFNELSVLIAEDVKVNQLVVSKMLKNLGVESIEFASNGQEALDKAVVGSYDMVLMDIQMPKLDGIEATRRIRAHYNSQEKEPPTIIALTANALKETIDDCQAAGMSDFISKPFKADKMREAITKYV